MISFIWVFIGGGLGSILRYWISKLFEEQGGAYPWGTFTANLLSCILLGVLLGFQMRSALDQKWTLLLTVGFCGGFSTFSTFSKECLNLLQDQQWGLALLYMFTSLLICTGAIFIGVRLTT